MHKWNGWFPLCIPFPMQIISLINLIFFFFPPWTASSGGGPLLKGEISRSLLSLSRKREEKQSEGKKRRRSRKQAHAELATEWKKRHADMNHIWIDWLNCSDSFEWGTGWGQFLLNRSPPHETNKKASVFFLSCLEAGWCYFNIYVLCQNIKSANQNSLWERNTRVSYAYLVHIVPNMVQTGCKEVQKPLSPSTPSWLWLARAPNRAQSQSRPAIRQPPPKTPPTAFRPRQCPISQSAKNRSRA